MRPNNAEVITGEIRSENIGEIKVQADIVVDRIEKEAVDAEQEAANLEMELMEAEAAHEAREEAERQAQETGENIGGLA